MALQFVFEFMDKMSGPASKMTASMEKLQAKTHAAGKESDDFFSRVESANKRVKDQFLEGLAEKFAVFELAKGAAELLGELVGKAAEVGFEFAKSAVEAGLFEQKSAIAFEKLAGGAEKGKAVLEEAKGFANQFAISYAESAELFKTGLLKGLDFAGPNSITKFAQVGVDLEKMGLGSAKNIVTAFGDVQEKGQLTARSLMAFKDTGINFDELAKKLGFLSAKHGGSFEALTEGLTNHAVPAAKAMPILLDIISEKFGVIGSSSERMGNLLDGQVQRLKNRWDDLLGRVAESGALDKVAALIGRIADSMANDPKWAEAFDKIFNTVSKLFDAFADADIDGLFEMVVEDVKDLGTVLGYVASYVKMIGEGLLLPVRLAETLLNTFTSLSTDISNVHDKIAGVFGGGQTENKLGGGVAHGAATAVLSGLIGPLAYGLPAFAEGGHVDGPTLAMVGEGGEGESIVPDSKMGGSVTLHQENHYHIEGGNHDAHELAKLMHDLGLGDIQGALDTLAQSMGAVNG